MTKYLIGLLEIENQLIDIAQKMIIHATTAPKARGMNHLTYSIITKDDIANLSKQMLLIAKESSLSFFERDSISISKSPVILLIGSKIHPIGLNYCSYCGFESCEQKSRNDGTPCTHNSIDLGIAVGIAANVAMQNGVDNRIMFSAGKAALDLGYFDPDVQIAYAIPLSISSKNIFFDR